MVKDYILRVSFYDGKKAETVNLATTDQIHDFCASSLLPDEPLNPQVYNCYVKGEVLLDSRGTGSLQQNRKGGINKE